MPQVCRSTLCCVLVSMLVLAPHDSNAAQERSLLQSTNPPFKSKDVVALARTLVSGRDNARSSPRTFKLTLGYSSSADIRVPRNARTADSYFDQALARLKARGGGVWRIEAGTYVLRNQIRISASNVHMIGAGIDRTIIKLADNAPEWKQAGFIASRSNDKWSVTDITFDGNRDKQTRDTSKHYGKYCNYLDLFEDVLFQRVKCTNWLRYGFDPHGYNKRIFSDGLVIIDCISTNNGWDGFTVDQTFNVLVRNCTAIGNGRHGFNIITGTRNCLVTNSTATDSGFGGQRGDGCAFMTDNLTNSLGTRDVTMSNNVADKAKKGGFCTQSGQDIKFLNNRISNVPVCGDFRYGTRRLEFSNNVCRRFRDRFRYVDISTSQITLRNNRFE